MMSFELIREALVQCGVISSELKAVIRVVLGLAIVV